MPKTKTYKVVGSSAIILDGVRHTPGAKFEAVPGEMGVLIEIGAVKELADKKP